MESSQLASAPPPPDSTASTGRADDWTRSLIRTAAILSGVAALLAGAVVLGFAVFGEPGGDDPSATWLAVGLVVQYLLIGVAVSITVANPGRAAMISAAVLAGLALIACVVTVVTMPDPGDGAWISHRQVLGAFAFGLTALGAGLLAGAEFAVRDGQGAPAPRGLVVRTSVLSVVFVIVLAAAGTAGAHDIAEAANTEATTAEAPHGPAATAQPATFQHLNPAYPGGAGALGTPYALLVTAPDMLAVTAYDADSGTVRWKHVRHNRTFAQPPLTSADGRVVALVGDRRDSHAGTSAIVLDTETGRLLSDRRLTKDEGKVLAVTSQVILFQPTDDPGRLTAYGYSGRELWSFEAPTRCLIGVAGQAGSDVVTAMDCSSDDVSADKPAVTALDERTGAQRWTWRAPVIGGIEPGSLLITDGKVIADVRRDVSTSEGLFAARLFRHDLTALNAADGTRLWRREALDLGSTYAVACAGTLQLAGPDVVLGECHHASAGGQATFDVATFSLADGASDWTASAPLGFTPGEGADPSGWFAALADGRVAMVTDSSNDITDPECALYLANAGKVTELAAGADSAAIADRAWCRTASLHATPDALSVAYTGHVFSLR